MKPYYYVLFIVAGTVIALIFVFIFFSPHNGGVESTNSTSTTTTTIPIFPPPTTSTTSSSQGNLPLTSSSSTTTSTSTTTTSTSSSLLPVSVVVSCSDDGTGFYTCKGTVSSTGGLPSGIEPLNWTIDQGNLSPIACTLVGNSTNITCGNILAGGSYSHKFTVTASYAGDSTHAPGSGSYSFTTGPKITQYLVTPEFPLGSIMMVLASIFAILAFAYVRTRRPSMEAA